MHRKRQKPLFSQLTVSVSGLTFLGTKGISVEDECLHDGGAADVIKKVRKEGQMSDFKEAEYRIVKLRDMHTAPYNPRYDLQPGDVNYDNLKLSVMKNGMIQPIVWNPITGNIVGGNQRFKILQEIGVDQVMCAVVPYETIEEEMAACIALNKARGKWENALLIKLFDQFDKDETDYNAMGFDREEVEHLYSGLDDLEEQEIFDWSQEPEKKPLMVKCPCCGKRFEERENRVAV